MTTKEKLLKLIDELPPSEYAVAERVLSALVETAWETGEDYALDDAPEDLATPYEIEAIREAKARIAAGERLIPHQEVMREIFGSDASAEDTRHGKQ